MRGGLNVHVRSGGRRQRGLGYADSAKRPRRARVALATMLVLAIGVVTARAEAMTLAQLLGMSPQPQPQTQQATTATTAPAAPPPYVAYPDTGYTRVRIQWSNQSSWATFSIDNASVVVAKVVAKSGSISVGSMGPKFSVKYAGTATIDAVLKIAPDAVTSLTMCKSHNAPSSIVLLRTTDTPAQLASMDNESTAPDTQPCADQLTQPLDRSALIGPSRFPARFDSRRLVLADYYPRFSADMNASTDYGDNPVGNVDTASAADVNSMMDTAQSVGIDGWLIEYEETAALNPRIDLAYDAADAHPGFYAALLLDLKILASRTNGVTAGELDTALSFFAAHASEPGQLMYQGKPVLFLYNGWRVTWSQWSAALQRAKAATGLDPYVVSDNTGLQNVATYAYSNLSSSYSTLAQKATSSLYSLRLQPSVAGTMQYQWIAPVTPGYDDSRLGRSSTTVIQRNNGETYDAEWSAAMLGLPDWILITSWNEWGEQTHILPGTSSGDLALQQTQVWTARFHANG